MKRAAVQCTPRRKTRLSVVSRPIKSSRQTIVTQTSFDPCSRVRWLNKRRTCKVSLRLRKKRKKLTVRLCFPKQISSVTPSRLRRRLNKKPNRSARLMSHSSNPMMRRSARLTMNRTMKAMTRPLVILMKRSTPSWPRLSKNWQSKLTQAYR